VNNISLFFFSLPPPLSLSLSFLHLYQIGTIYILFRGILEYPELGDSENRKIKGKNVNGRETLFIKGRGDNICAPGEGNQCADESRKNILRVTL